MKVTVAGVVSRVKPDDDENIQRAQEYVDEAVKQGAKIVCFPEDYIHGAFQQSKGMAIPPGKIETYPGVKAIQRKAKEHGVYIIPGTMAERTKHKQFYNTALLVNPLGKIVGRYRKTHLAVGENKNRIAGEEEELFKIFKTEYGNIGIKICYELCFPEVARITALAGAEIIFWPSGGLFYEIRETWRHLFIARAIENLTYVIGLGNVLGMEQGIGIIAAPEGVLAERTTEGVVTATLDVDRIRWLRKTPESYDLPKPFKCVPGAALMRIPKMYRSLCNAKLQENYERTCTQKDA